MSSSRCLTAAATLLFCLSGASSGALAATGAPSESSRPAGHGVRTSAVAAPSRAHGATIARVVVPTLVRAKPGSARNVWLARTQTSWAAKAQSLLVLGSRSHGGQQWLRVLLPLRPDGRSGWIPRNNVALSTTHWWIDVDKERRTVAVFGHGRLARRFDAVIGKPATPTPDGLAAIYEVDRQPGPEGFLGTWALPLTILSNTLHNFGGGPGRIAIHGRGGASLADPLGSASSHGCIRLDNASVGWLASRIRPGTPVRISG